MCRGALAAITTLAAIACGGGQPAQRAQALDVVATTTMVADLVRNVGGPHVAVASLMGPGVDPHLYRAKAGDVERLSGADIVFFNGLHLEAKLAEVLERLGERRRVIAVTDGIDRARLLAPPEFSGAWDPHVWFDVTLWSECVASVADALAQADPEHAPAYAESAESYRTRLAELDGYVRRRAAEIPERQRVLVTAHDAFNYFGRAYGFEVRGLQGISTAAEAGTGDVQTLAAFVAERRGGQLFSDALGDPGTVPGTYEGMVRHNVDAIVDALGRGST